MDCLEKHVEMGVLFGGTRGWGIRVIGKTRDSWRLIANYLLILAFTPLFLNTKPPRFKENQLALGDRKIEASRA